VLWFGGLVLTVLGFILGRVFSQSEAILAEKRRVYEQFLIDGPNPNETYDELSEELVNQRNLRFQNIYGPMLFYASPSVARALSAFWEAFYLADEKLSPSSPALHSDFKKVAKAHNDLILEMRRDAFGWSVFGFRGTSRISNETLSEAKLRSE